MHKDAIVTVQRHEIGDSAERDQIQKIRNRRWLGDEVARLHFARERGHEIERNAHARQCLARKIIARCIRINDCIRLWQRRRTPSPTGRSGPIQSNQRLA